jgi:hypothetical protein
MSIYKTRRFSRRARRQGLTDSTLWQAVREIREGLYEADLGGRPLWRELQKLAK